MIKTRAKFRCMSETRHSYNPESRTYRFGAIYDPHLPEDQRFAKATPSGTVEIVVDNPAVHYTLGQDYYFDIIPAEVTA